MIDLSSIRMTFPNTQSEAETRAIFEAFREAHPRQFAEWRAIEQRGVKGGELTLQPCQALVRKFVMERTQCEARPAAISVFMELRMLMAAEIRGCTLSDLKASFQRVSPPDS